MMIHWGDWVLGCWVETANEVMPTEYYSTLGYKLFYLENFKTSRTGVGQPVAPPDPVFTVVMW